jgi:hypothetical protein
MLLHAIARAAGDADPAVFTWLPGLPHLGGWANDGLIRLDQGTPPDLAYLACEASAAVRTGVPSDSRRGSMLMDTPRRIAPPNEIGAGLVTGGGALMGVGAVLAAGQHGVWSNPWFDGGCAALAVGGVLLSSAVIPWWRSRRRGTPAPEVAAQQWEDPDQDSPLRLLPQRGVWRPFGGTAWSFGLPIRITNITEEPITLAHYRLLNGPGQATWPPFSPDVQAAVDASIAALSAEHSSELFMDEIVVPPGESITRWFIGSTYALLPGGDRPALALQFEDVSGDTYNVYIPARKRRSF